MALQDTYMTVPMAQRIYESTTKGFKKFGLKFSSPYKNEDIMQALVVLQEATPPEVEEAKAVIAELRDELRKLAQSKAGLNTANKKLRKQVKALEDEKAKIQDALTTLQFDNQEAD
jgi:septal ring factor EnvC (AmiA/AmiB activator)